MNIYRNELEFYKLYANNIQLIQNLYIRICPSCKFSQICIKTRRDRILPDTNYIELFLIGKFLIELERKNYKKNNIREIINIGRRYVVSKSPSDNIMLNPYWSNLIQKYNIWQFKIIIYLIGIKKWNKSILWWI